MAELAPPITGDKQTCVFFREPQFAQNWVDRLAVDCPGAIGKLDLVVHDGGLAISASTSTGDTATCFYTLRLLLSFFMLHN